MFTSFSTALSALSATDTAIDVVGNNLANLDTTGFKASTVSFEDLVTQSLGAGLGETQVGFGVGAPVTQTQFTQGSTQTTSGLLDAAIQGGGFFIVQGPNSTTEYTRDGSFQTDANGDLTTATGEVVQGWTIDSSGVVDTNAPIGNITIPTGTLMAPTPTGNISLSMNLNAAATQGNADATFSTSIQIYDSLGVAHTVTATFTQDATTPNTWDYSISVPSGDLTSAFTPVTGTLTFSSSGQLVSPASGSPIQIPITGYADGAADQTLNWNLYNGTTPLLTQYAQTSSVTSDDQDGSAAAQLTSVGIAEGGQILAKYSDGQQQVVGQLAMATIRNPDSLVASGNNNYELGANTALPAIGLPNTGGRGDVTGGALEASTVDIATEFTNLIVFQRGYEANAKVITTVDQLSQDTINLKQ